MHWLACASLAALNAACPQLLRDDFTLVADPLGTSEPRSGLPGTPDAGAVAPVPDGGDDRRWGWSSQWRDGAAGSSGTPAPTCVSSSERCDGLDNDCDGTVDQGATCPADCAGVQILGRSYLFCGGSGVVAGVADSRCTGLELQLVRIESAAENTALLDAAASLYGTLAQLDETQPSIWIGAQDLTLEGTRRWGLAGPVFWLGNGTGAAQNGAYENWVSGKPNDNTTPSGEDCGVLYVGSGSEPVGQWNDIDCTTSHAYLCEQVEP